MQPVNHAGQPFDGALAGTAGPGGAAGLPSGAVDPADVDSAGHLRRGLLGKLLWLFPALSYREYRFLWQGNLGFFLGQTMQATVEGWLIYQLTGSPFYLSVLTLCRSIPTLVVAPVLGVAADRSDRRRILVGSQLVSLVTALAVAALVVSGKLQPWHLLAAAAVGGGVSGAFVPARQALTTALVPRRRLVDAFSVHATSMGATGVVGPQIAGFLLAASSAATCYVAQAAGCVWGILYHLRIRSGFVKVRREREGIVKGLLGGVSYARRDPAIRGIMILMLLYTVMLYPFMQFLPAFAKDVLKTGAPGLGMLMASGGFGALTGSLLAGWLGRARAKGVLLIAGCLLYGALEILFSQSQWMWLSMISVFGTGIGGGIVQVVSLTAAQSLVPDSHRARIGSLDMTIWGLMPLGTVPIGFIAGSAGIAVTVAIVSGLGLVCVLALGGFMPALRRLEC